MMNRSSLQANAVDVAIIGAGPYGLSVAAHLNAEGGRKHRIFGQPMSSWLTQMPKGMRLKSEGFASSLFDPKSSYTLRHYCEEQGLPYADSGLPVPIETFTAYGLAFQQKLVPELETKTVTSVQKISGGFEVGLEDGETFVARRVVVAAGISHFGYVPPQLSALPGGFVTHSSEYGDLSGFKGREIAVVGAGSSAVDIAALLHRAGASVQLIARKPNVRFHDPPKNGPRTLLERLRYPSTGLGPGWKLFFYANAPWMFHRMPKGFRLKAVRRVLGPATGWFVKDQVMGKVGFNLGVEITNADVENARVRVELTERNGKKRTIVADHLIAATGYRVDLRRLKFLSPDLLSGIRTLEESPILSPRFESSVPGLYFVGTAAANSFGPLMRFAFGAGFAARRVTKDLRRSVLRDTTQAVTHADVGALERS